MSNNGWKEWKSTDYKGNLPLVFKYEKASRFGCLSVELTSPLPTKQPVATAEELVALGKFLVEQFSPRRADQPKKPKRPVYQMPQGTWLPHTRKPWIRGARPPWTYSMDNCG